MVSRIPRSIRAFASVLAVAAYALPATIGMVSALGHTASHLVDEAKEQHRVATSLGLTHGNTSEAAWTGARERGFLASAAAVATDAVVHTHGGSTHAHGGAVGDLMSASNSVDGQMSANQAAPTTLATHMPPPDAPVVLAMVTSEDTESFDIAAPASPDLSGLLQPPRA